MLPFIGYHGGDYFRHWLEIGKGAGEGAGDPAMLPKIFYVNWFRRDADGGFLWPGFGENSRVLKWVMERLDGSAAAVETPIGHVPGAGALDIGGLDMSAEQLAAALKVDPQEWAAEIPLIEEWFAKIGDSVPTSRRDELDALKLRLGLS
jgi:phosphoenolpyruvate carboxykinase (GTP)